MSDRLEEIKRTFRQYYGTYRADMEWLVAEVARLVAETQRLTRELAEKQAALDRNWQLLQASDLGAAALRAAGQRLHDTAEAYRHHDERRSWIDDADALDAAFVGWARLTTKEPPR